MDLESHENEARIKASGLFLYLLLFTRNAEIEEVLILQVNYLKTLFVFQVLGSNRMQDTGMTHWPLNQKQIASKYHSPYARSTGLLLNIATYAEKKLFCFVLFFLWLVF